MHSFARNDYVDKLLDSNIRAGGMLNYSSNGKAIQTDNGNASSTPVALPISSPIQESSTVNNDPEERRKMLLQLSFGIIDRGKLGKLNPTVQVPAQPSLPPPPPLPPTTSLPLPMSLSDGNRYSDEAIFRMRGMQQSPDDLDYPHSDDLLNNHSTQNHLRGDDRVDPVPNTATTNTTIPTVSIPQSNEELFASIDKALSISLKRPSSRGSNLDLLATNVVNTKVNNGSAADIRNGRSRGGGTGRVNNENKPGNVMSMSSSTSRDDGILVNSSVIPVPAAEESNNRDYSEGEGSETSRSQTMSNLTTSTQSYGYNHSGNGRRNWSPLPSSRIGFDFRAPFPSVRHSPSNDRRSHQSHHSMSSGRISVESGSAYHDSHNSSSSSSANRNNNKLTIGFKKSNEGDYVQGLLSQKKSGSLYKDTPPHPDPLASRHSAMRFSMAPNSARQMTKHTYGGVQGSSLYSEYGSPLNISRSQSTGRVIRSASSFTINHNRNSFHDNGRSGTPTPGYLHSTSSYTKKSTNRASPSRLLSQAPRNSSGNISFSHKPAAAAGRTLQSSPSYFPDNAENSAVSYYGLSEQHDNTGEEMHTTSYQVGGGGYSSSHVADNDHVHGHSHTYNNHPDDRRHPHPQHAENHSSRARDRFNSFYDGSLEEDYGNDPSPDRAQQPYSYYNADAEHPNPRGGSGYSQYNSSNNNGKSNRNNGNQLNSNSGSINFYNQHGNRSGTANGTGKGIGPRGRVRSSSAQPNNRDSFRDSFESRQRGSSVERAQMHLLYGELDDISELKKKWMKSLRK
eukprot:gene25926-34521_t